MSETATIEPPAAPAAPVSFRDVIASAMQGITSEPAAPEPEAPPAAPVAAEEPKVTPPADPLKELSTPETPEFKLPIDEEEEPEKAAEEPDTSEIKAGRRIKELKEEVKTKWQPKVAELEQSKAQLESRVAEMEARLAAVEELETKVKTYEEEMSVVKLEKHPKYIREVREPLQAKVTEATVIAKKYDIPTEDLLDALEIGDASEAEAKLEALTSGLDVRPLDLLKLMKIHGDVQPILAKRDELLSKADQALAELQVAGEKEAQQKSLARAEERKQIVPVITERLMAKLGFIKDDLPALADATAATDLDALDTPNIVYNHMAGLAMPKVLAKASAIQRENDRLLDEIESLKKALPRFEGGMTHTGGTAKPKNFLEALKRDLGKA
jgi:hypothetical protein